MRLYEKYAGCASKPFERQGEVVFDSNTGLYWEFKSVHKEDVNYGGRTFTFSGAAKIHIQELNDGCFGGCADWRVPNKDELRSMSGRERPATALWSSAEIKQGGRIWRQTVQ